MPRLIVATLKNRWQRVVATQTFLQRSLSITADPLHERPLTTSRIVGLALIEALRFSIWDLAVYTLVVASSITIGKTLEMLLSSYSTTWFVCLSCGGLLHWVLVYRFFAACTKVVHGRAGNLLGIGQFAGMGNYSYKRNYLGLHFAAAGSYITLIAVGSLKLGAAGPFSFPILFPISMNYLMLANLSAMNLASRKQDFTPVTVLFFDRGVALGMVRFFPWSNVELRPSDWIVPGVVIQQKPSRTGAKPDPLVVKVSSELLEKVLAVAESAKLPSPTTADTPEK